MIVTEDWEYPEPEATEGDEDADEDEATDEAESDEPVKVYRQMWVVTDIEASGLVHRSRVGRTDDSQGDDTDAHDDEPTPPRPAARSAAGSSRTTRPGPASC